MKQIQSVLFYLTLSLFITHELDAVMNQEWLVLPLTSWLSPDLGYEVFLWAHVPLFFFLIFCLCTGSERIKAMCSLGLSMFCVIHAFLHWFFTDHVHYEFSSVSSHILIYGSAVLAGVYLIIRKITR